MAVFLQVLNDFFSGVQGYEATVVTFVFIWDSHFDAAGIAVWIEIGSNVKPGVESWNNADSNDDDDGNKIVW